MNATQTFSLKPYACRIGKPAAANNSVTSKGNCAAAAVAKKETFSGFGVMGSCAGGELLACHITESALPDYAPAFLLARYEDAAYHALLDRWGDGGQL